MSRLARKNRTEQDLGILSSGGLIDAFDNFLKVSFRINDAEYDYICETATDDDLKILVNEKPTFTEKRVILLLLEKFIDRYNNLNI